MVTVPPSVRCVGPGRPLGLPYALLVWCSLGLQRMEGAPGLRRSPSEPRSALTFTFTDRPMSQLPAFIEALQQEPETLESLKTITDPDTVVVRLLEIAQAKGYSVTREDLFVVLNLDPSSTRRQKSWIGLGRQRSSRVRPAEGLGQHPVEVRNEGQHALA